MDLMEVYTLEEAAFRWGIKYITLKQRFYRGVDKILTKELDYKRSGKIYLVTKNGMIKLYGLPKGETKRYIIKGFFEIEKLIKDLDLEDIDLKTLNGACMRVERSISKQTTITLKDRKGNDISIRISLKEDGYLFEVI